LFIFAVEACVASWIEIELLLFLFHQVPVEACVASWIEIGKVPVFAHWLWSKPVWLRGLKFPAK
jgi:hypothetical protein